MSVHEVLARTDGGFIGLHDLLTNIAQANGCTYQQAAQVLFRLLQAAQDQRRPAPVWRSYSRAAGMRQAGPTEKARALTLLQIAANGGEKALWEELDDIPF